ncbi:MAG: hypothetical protein KDA99_15240, partial [Planctomycetales bacterium]|nr:hypothetical protein [Planctomycetales bacterium]
MRRLDFIIGGGQRCGSTTIATMLARHADVCLCQPLRPEPKFFLHDKHEAPALAARIDQSLAHAAADVTAVGEKSTSYL